LPRLLDNTGDALFVLSSHLRVLRPDFLSVALQGGTHDIVDEPPQPWCEVVAALFAS
jgi:hypothetical protein